MIPQIEVLVDMCLKGLQDSHPKVRWASCQALGQMCTDLGPNIQDTCHHKILPALMALMDDFNNPRVQVGGGGGVVGDGFVIVVGDMMKRKRRIVDVGLAVGLNE